MNTAVTVTAPLATSAAIVAHEQSITASSRESDMTDEEYTAQVNEVLEGVHPVLASALRMNAYDHGHSSGREEALGILQGLVYDFRKVNDVMLNGDL
jgi:hypothetical protein